MNKAQKISILVCVFSAVVFIATTQMYSDIWTGIGVSGAGRPIYTYNYLGIIAIGLGVAGFVGYFILGDKKN